MIYVLVHQVQFVICMPDETKTQSFIVMPKNSAYSKTIELIQDNLNKIRHWWHQKTYKITLH